MISHRFAWILVTFAILLNMGCATTIVVTATPEPTVPIQADPAPTTWRDVPTEVWANEMHPIDLSREQLDILSTVGPIPTWTPVPRYTPIPSPTPLAIPLPAEVTDGVRAVAACTGKPESFWLEHGPPALDAELVQCINEYLEAN